jgi:hypothetical protein
VPVSGVVVAKPSLCQNYPGATNWRQPRVGDKRYYGLR